jgi:predicted ATPase
MSVPIDRPLVCPVVIGRAAHAEALDGLRAEARRGAGHVGLISGEAGVGKSRLIADTTARAAATGDLVLQGRCFEPDRAVPYAPLIDLLHAWLGTTPRQHPAATPEPLSSELATLLSDLEGRSGQAAAELARDPHRAKRRWFQKLADLLTRRTASTPLLLLVVEDVHWSDETSLDFLLHLARAVAGRHILLLAQLPRRRDAQGRARTASRPRPRAPGNRAARAAAWSGRARTHAASDPRSGPPGPA